MKDVVTNVVPLGIKDPKAVVKEGEAILGELSGWGVRVAVGKPRLKSGSRLTPHSIAF